MSNKCNCQLPNTDLGGRCFKCGGFVEIPISKPMTPQDRIITEAQAATNVEEKRLKQSPIRNYDRMVSELYGYNKGYIAGATAEASNNESLQMQLEAQDANVEILLNQKKELVDKTQVLVDALEFVKNNGLCSETTEMINNALEQWKSGKGKGAKVYRPCPHCGKELFRDRNLCCRACGKEVTNG